jgi:hypothetical protein
MEPYRSIFVDRGPPGGNMTTDGILFVASNQQAYRIGKRGLEVSRSHVYAVDLESAAANPEKVKEPPYLEVSAKWDKTPHESGVGNNILGDNGLLSLPSEILQVPSVEATHETLAYYGAILLKQGDVVRFPDAQYPIFTMSVGSRYVEEYLMAGPGYYLEYHHDKPHFHMPIDGGGHYLLAKWKEEGTKLQITAFRIQNGDAVYTKKGAIHCDGALWGKLIVGYDKAENCSTALLRTEENKKVQLQFI